MKKNILIACMLTLAVAYGGSMLGGQTYPYFLDPDPTFKQQPTPEIKEATPHEPFSFQEAAVTESARKASFHERIRFWIYGTIPEWVYDRDELNTALVAATPTNEIMQLMQAINTEPEKKADHKQTLNELLGNFNIAKMIKYFKNFETALNAWPCGKLYLIRFKIFELSKIAILASPMLSIDLTSDEVEALLNTCIDAATYLNLLRNKRQQKATLKIMDPETQEYASLSNTINKLDETVGRMALELQGYDIMLKGWVSLEQKKIGFGKSKLDTIQRKRQQLEQAIETLKPGVIAIFKAWLSRIRKPHPQKLEAKS